MTSVRSCKNPERGWFTETLRRYKSLPALIAVAYFLSNILPILLFYSEFESVVLYVRGSMMQENAFNMMIGIAGGIVVSCAVFKYLHSTASVIDAHSKPLTRGQLFKGSFFAGLAMLIAPVLLTGLFYLCVMGANCSSDAANVVMSYGFDPQTVLTLPNIIGWILDSIVVIGFSYCVSCLAAILSGTSVIQVLLSLLMISLPTVIYLFVEGYMSTFLYGFDGSADLLRYLSPYGYMMSRSGYPFSEVPAAIIVYALAAALAAFAAVIIYKKLKLENVEKTIVVPAVAEILVMFLTAAAVSMVLFIIEAMMGDISTLGAIVTVVLATIVFFPIFCMIADQSFRVFKSRNFKIFVIYAAVMCVVLAFTLFDVTGFEKRVPDTEEVAGVDVSDSNLYNQDIKDIRSGDTIAAITALHESLAKNGPQPDINCRSGIRIAYKLKNGKTLIRFYDAVYEDSFDKYAVFYDSEEVRKHECFDTDNPLRPGMYMSLDDIHVDEDGNVQGPTYQVEEKYQKGLLEAANKDMMKWTADNQKLFDFSEDYDPAEDNSTYSIGILVDYSASGSDRMDLEAYSKCCNFTTLDKNVLKYIEDHPDMLSKKNIIKSDDPRVVGSYEF